MFLNIPEVELDSTFGFWLILVSLGFLFCFLGCIGMLISFESVSHHVEELLLDSGLQGFSSLASLVSGNRHVPLLA